MFGYHIKHLAYQRIYQYLRPDFLEETKKETGFTVCLIHESHDSQAAHYFRLILMQFLTPFLVSDLLLQHTGSLWDFFFNSDFHHGVFPTLFFQTLKVFDSSRFISKNLKERPPEEGPPEGVKQI
jgi:hypothetical protein